MIKDLMNKTHGCYKDNIVQSNIACSLGADITSKDKKRVFLKAGTPITKKMNDQIELLNESGVIELLSLDDSIQLDSPIEDDEIINSIIKNITSNPVLTQYQLTETFKTINDYVSSGQIPKKIVEHLTVFSQNNEIEFENTLSNLVFGTHIGKANNYSESELNELMSVLFFENIGFCRLDLKLKNAYKSHPIVSKEIVEYAGINNKLVLESILQHEEMLDGTGYPNQLTKMHEYAQISQMANQHSKLIKQEQGTVNLLGKLFLSGLSFDFRTSSNKETIYGSKLQKTLMKVMLEKLKSPQQFIEYGRYLHQELGNIIQWSHSHSSFDDEVVMIQQKINSTLWVGDHNRDPFQVSLEQLKDLSLCKGFITDSMNFLYQIAESANYLNCHLHEPIKINGFAISGENCLDIATPLRR